MGSTAEMPFLDHLEELRWRIIWSLAALIVGVAAAFVLVYRFDLLTWIQGPILPFLHGHKLVYTHPGDGFSILLQTSIMAANGASRRRLGHFSGHGRLQRRRQRCRRRHVRRRLLGLGKLDRLRRRRFGLRIGDRRVEDRNRRRRASPR